jgi:hypothetical protein
MWKWRTSNVITGLIYDETINHLYITEYNGTSTDTLVEFSEFITMDKPQYEDRKYLRRWNFFFDKDCGIINNEKKPTISIR